MKSMRNSTKFVTLVFFLSLLSVCRLSESSSSSSVRATATISSVINRLDSNKASPSQQVNAAKGVLHRLLPSHSSAFNFQIITKEACGGNSCFQISNCERSMGDSAEIMIKGTSAVDITSGLHWYLKYWCGAHVSWDKTGGAQLGSVPKPGSLPRVKDAGLLIQRLFIN